MSDFPHLAGLQRAYDLIPEFAGRTDYSLRRAYDLALEHGLWVCTLADSAPAAFAAAYERQGSFYLWLLGVRPDLRRKGLASTLFQKRNTPEDGLFSSRRDGNQANWIVHPKPAHAWLLARNMDR